MFCKFYAFTRTPFSKTIPTGELFPTSGQAELAARLAYLLKESGFGLVTGEIGSGKSTAVRAFASSLDPNRHLVLYLSNPTTGITGIYRELLTSLGHEPPFGKPRMVALLLVGHPDLRRTLRLSVHEALFQRITIRHHLGPMDLAETLGYVKHQVRIAGHTSDPIFTDEAIARVFDYTKGLPRRINQVCTTALMAGLIEQKTLLDEATIRKAIADIDQE